MEYANLIKYQVIANAKLLISLTQLLTPLSYPTSTYTTNIPPHYPITLHLNHQHPSSLPIITTPPHTLHLNHQHSTSLPPLPFASTTNTPPHYPFITTTPH
ncbi:hypothetical protein Pcinc_042881 [Petrolisthes cinctipes]|uniref:Uncharacterized protein n=1 Tax=Petrolisthes cinctipes TaxID=88211 RepID=A0AAE1BGM1_PETCI|nr:hypothetical protein Pcinc_042881 [Petrolisthes cinctipes]